MSRIELLCGLALLIALGCRAREAPPAPVKKAADASAAAEQSPSSGSSQAQSPPSAATPPSSPAAPSGNFPLREILSRLLASDPDGGWRIDEQAATDLEQLGPQPADLLPLLSDQQVEVRRGAAYALQGAFDPADAQHVEAANALLGDADATVRAFGLAAVRQLRRDEQIEAVPRLSAMLDPAQETRPETRAGVARLLGGLRRDAAQAVEPLASSAAGDPDAKVRAAALAALAQVGEPERVMPQLVEALEDSDPAVRIVATGRLRQFGPAAASAAPALVRALADDQQNVRESAAEALVRIGAPAVPLLIGQLAGSNIEARKLALFALAGIGPAAKDALPAVERCRRDSDADVRKLADLAAARIGG